MLDWQLGQGPVIPAKLAGTLNCTPHAAQEKVNESVIMAGKEKPIARLGVTKHSVNSGIRNIYVY